MSDTTVNSRSAIRAAMHQADLARTSAVKRIDPYEREARSIITPVLCTDDVTERIIRRMALKPTSTTATTCVFAIEHSSAYSTLTVHTSNGKVVNYVLL